MDQDNDDFVVDFAGLAENRENAMETEEYLEDLEISFDDTFEVNCDKLFKKIKEDDKGNKKYECIYHEKKKVNHSYAGYGVAFFRDYIEHHHPNDDIFTKFASTIPSRARNSTSYA